MIGKFDCIENVRNGTGEIVQKLRALEDFIDDPDSVPNTHMLVHNLL